MDCYFWTFSKPKNSTKRPSLNDAVIIRANTATEALDLERPQLVFNLGMGQEDNPTAYNMVYVPALGRHYRCTWRTVEAMWIADCEEDTLATWKAEIGALNAYILRSSAEWDGNIIDTLYPTKAEPIINSSDITAPWTVNDLAYTTGCFVVGTISKDGATEYTALTPTQFKNFALKAFSDEFFNGVRDEMYITKAIFDPMQYLSSVTWFPFNVGGQASQSISLGYWSTVVTGSVVSAVSISTVTVTLPKHPQISRGAYLNGAPYTTYMLDLRPFGRIAIDPASVMNTNSVTLQIVTDTVTGNAIMRIYAGDSLSAPVIGMQSAQLGVKVQISQVLRDYYSGAMGAISSTVGAVGSFLTGNIAGGIQGALSAIDSGVRTAYPDVSTSGLNSGVGGLYGNWKLTTKFYIVVDEDMDHRGRPLCKVKQISTVPGYLLCSDVEVNLPATPNEIDTIKAYMEGGFYYE